MILRIELPDEATVEDFTTVGIALMKASSEFIDWNNSEPTNSMPGRILIRLVHGISVLGESS